MSTGSSLAYAYFCASLMFAVIILFGCGLFRARKHVALAISLLAVIIQLLSLNGDWDTLSYLTGVMSPLSASFLVFSVSAGACVFRGSALFSARDEFTFALVVLVTSSVLFASSFGLIGADIYASGYTRNGVLVFCGLVLAAAALTRSWMILIWLSVAAVIKALGLIESANMWDFVVDPIGWLTSLCLVNAYFFQGVSGRAVPFFGYRMSARPGRYYRRWTGNEGNPG